METTINLGHMKLARRIYNNSDLTTPIGADCIDYSVGTSSNIYNPTTISSSASSEIEMAHELGQNLYRADFHGVDDCITSSALTSAGYNNTNETFSSMPTIDCTAAGYLGDSDVAANINAAANLANHYGMMYIEQLAADDTNVDHALISSSTSSCPGSYDGTNISDFQCAAYEMAKDFPNVTTWEDWNEMNGDGTLSETEIVNQIIKPVYLAIHQAATENGETEQAYAGSFIGAYSNVVSYLSTLLQDDGNSTNYMDGIDIHTYGATDDTLEELGLVVPQYDTIPGQSAKSGGLDQIKNLMNGKPIINTEFGIWQSGTSEAADQGNGIVRGTILQNSIGITNISIFQNSQCNATQGVTWGTVSCGNDGGDLPAALAQSTMESELDSPTKTSGNRSFLQWVPTGPTVSGQYEGDPHVYAALYGPSDTQTNDVLAIWADDYTNTVIPTLSGGGTLNITSEYGAPSTLASGGTLTINGEVQYISVPAGQTISFAPAETYGPNLALASSGATFTGSSYNTSCGSLTQGSNNNNMISGYENLDSGANNNGIYGGCDNGQMTGWSQSPSDSSPSITIDLGASQSIDRVFLAGTSGFSVNPKVGSFTVQTSTNGSTYTTVNTMPDQLFQRNHMDYFSSPVTAQYVKILINNIDYTGFANGLPPVWWNFSDLTSQNSTDYGSADVYDVEVYGAGSSNSSTSPPLVSITSPSSSTNSHGTETITASATDRSGSGISKVEFFGNGTLLGTDTTSPYSYSWNTLTGSVPNTTSYSLTAEAFDNDNDSATSSPVTVCVNNGDVNNDGVVNINDLSVMAENWGTSGATYAQGNIDNQSSVNIQDLSVLAENWGFNCSQ